MNAAAIKEHLSMLMDLEKEIYTQNQVIASLEYKLSGLPDYRQYVKPVYQQASPHYYDDTAANVAFLCLPGAVLLFVLGLLLYDFRGFFWEIALLAFIVGIIAFFISRLNASDAQHSADVESKKRYDAALKAYNLSVEQDRLRVERERPKKLLLQGQLKTLKDAHKKTVDTLNKLYNKGVTIKNIGVSFLSVPCTATSILAYALSWKAMKVHTTNMTLNAVWTESSRNWIRSSSV